MRKLPLVESFNFPTGKTLAGKYRVVSKLGEGWEGEVYKICEIDTGIERAGKFFYPHRNQNNKTVKFHAQKLHKLRHCNLMIRYNTIESIQFRRHKVPFLVSEFIVGVLLSDFIRQQPGKRLLPFQALHLLYALSKGLDEVHQLKEYHGDLHAENIMITRYGLDFGLKVFDLFHWKAATKENIQDDVCDLIRIFYDVLGGARTYSKHPVEIRSLICGLKRSLILQKYKTAGQLRLHLENLSFSSLVKGRIL